MPPARGRAQRKDPIDRRQLFRRQRNIRRGRVSFKIGDLVSAGNRHEEIALMKNPCQRQLRHRAFLHARDRLQLFEQTDIVLKILGVKARPAPLGFLLAELGEIVPLAA